MKRDHILFALLILPSQAAQAADWYTGAATESDYAKSIVIDMSADVTKNSAFGAATATMILSGRAGETGARARIEALGGGFNYVDGAGAHISARQESGTAYVGYEWISPNLTMAAYGGLNAQYTRFSVQDPSNQAAGTQIGVKGSGEIYATPTRNTMFSAYGSYASANNAYYARIKYGWKITDTVYAGPELTLLGDRYYEQWRAGVHFTGFRIGALQLGLSGGLVNDRALGSGAYGLADARIGF